MGYYRQYIEDFAEVSFPLTLLTCKGQDWIWSCDQEQAFQQITQNLVTAPVLRYLDPNLTCILDTDASASGVGAVLSQEIDGVNAFYSKTIPTLPIWQAFLVTDRSCLSHMAMQDDRTNEPSCPVVRNLGQILIFHRTTRGFSTWKCRLAESPTC